MDMNKIKYAVLWLLMLSMALPFSACAGNPPAPARSEESSGPESAPPDSGTAEPTADTRFPVVRDGKAVPIVYPMDDLDAMGYAKTVANKIKSLTGVDAECREDSRRVDEEADTESYEIFSVASSLSVAFPRRSGSIASTQSLCPSTATSAPP